MAAAFEAEESAEPFSDHSRWCAGYCSACGAISWHDFRDPSSAYYRPPAKDDDP